MCVCVCVWLHQVLVVACRILLPNQGGILGPRHWEHTVSAIQPPGKSWTSCSGRKEGTGRQTPACLLCLVVLSSSAEMLPCHPYFLSHLKTFASAALRFLPPCALTPVSTHGTLPFVGEEAGRHGASHWVPAVLHLDNLGYPWERPNHGVRSTLSCYAG